MRFTQSSDSNKALYDTSLPEPTIPTRTTPWFMKALWALAVLMVIGLIYSFWRISHVASPTLDVPTTPSTDTATPK